MKTKNIFLIIVFFIGIIPLIAKDSLEYMTLTGTVKDKNSKKKLEYVSVSVQGSGIGTITNADGEFSLKLKEVSGSQIIEFSRLNYEHYVMHLDKNDMEDILVFLSPNAKVLDDTEIDATNLMRMAISGIKDNYSGNNHLLTGFYRETVKKRNKYVTVSEAIVNIYKTPYQDDVNNDRVQIYKGRRLISPTLNDSIIVKLQGGPSISIHADIVKNSGLILNSDFFNCYRFEMDKPTKIEGRPHYVVKFHPKELLSYPLYEGKFYIDRESLVFSCAEFHLTMNDKNKVIQSILNKRPFKMHFKPEKVAFFVTYKHVNGSTYLNYVRNEVKFKCDWKKKLFSTGYTIVSETVITDIKQKNINGLSKTMPEKNQSLSDEVNDFYDEDYWEDYNIIEPSESLETGINKLKKQSKV